jgi:ankyrin repeat protein
LDIVKTLLHLGVLVNTKDEKGQTPLYAAAMNGMEYIVKELLKVDGCEHAVYHSEDGPVDLQALTQDVGKSNWLTADEIAAKKGHISIARAIQGEYGLIYFW